MKNKLVLFFSFVLVAMLIVTTWASLQENVIVGAMKLFQEPWGIATLADTYFGFLTFYIWVLYKEQSLASKTVWLILILTLGNIAMAIYALLQIRKSKSMTFESIVLKSTKATGS